MKHNTILANKNSLFDYSKDYSFNGIDLVKFLCAYLVCMIHINPIVELEGNLIDVN